MIPVRPSHAQINRAPLPTPCAVSDCDRKECTERTLFLSVPCAREASRPMGLMRESVRSAHSVHFDHKRLKTNSIRMHGYKAGRTVQVNRAQKVCAKAFARVIRGEFLERNPARSRADRRPPHKALINGSFLADSARVTERAPSCYLYNYFENPKLN